MSDHPKFHLVWGSSSTYSLPNLIHTESYSMFCPETLFLGSLPDTSQSFPISPNACPACADCSPQDPQQGCSAPPDPCAGSIHVCAPLLLTAAVLPHWCNQWQKSSPHLFFSSWNSGTGKQYRTSKEKRAKHLDETWPNHPVIIFTWKWQE